MRLAEVVGPVWGARRASSLDGRKLLLLRPLSTGEGAALDRREPPFVAVDDLGAGPGELVLVAHGSRCRDLTVGPQVAAKEVVIAIVDSVDLDAAARAAEGRR